MGATSWRFKSSYPHHKKKETTLCGLFLFACEVTRSRTDTEFFGFTKQNAAVAARKHSWSTHRVRSGEFKSSYPHQISTVIMIRKRIVKAVLVFYSKALIYKAFLLFKGSV